MSCQSCSTGGCSTLPKGCNNNGGCSSGGCNKLNSFDWFANLLPPGTEATAEVYEIRFKNTHKAFFRNVNSLPLITGDIVSVEGDRGFDVGQVSLSGVLAQLQLKKHKVREQSEKVRKIYRHANDEDLGSLKKARAREHDTLVKTREIIRNMDLDMKLSDVEFQGDNTKATFYYIADKRVDFRQLIKVLAEEFRIRVEMKQIGLRFEAGLVGGIGSCGRELCCSTWLTDFKSVATGAARYQNLSLNPMKISGQCGRLKCCLNYELDTYLDALQDIPKVHVIETEMGRGILQKTDIFKRVMWFSYETEQSWVAVSAELAWEMMELNRRGGKPASLRAIRKEDDVLPQDEPIDYADTVGQAKLTRDPQRRQKRRPSSGQQNNPRQQNTSGQQQGGQRQGPPRERPEGQGPRSGGNRDRRNRNRGRGRNDGPKKPGNDAPPPQP